MRVTLEYIGRGNLKVKTQKATPQEMRYHCRFITDEICNESVIILQCVLECWGHQRGKEEGGRLSVRC